MRHKHEANLSEILSTSTVRSSWQAAGGEFLFSGWCNCSAAEEEGAGKEGSSRCVVAFHCWFLSCRDVTLSKAHNPITDGVESMVRYLLRCFEKRQRLGKSAGGVSYISKLQYGQKKVPQVCASHSPATSACIFIICTSPFLLSRFLTRWNPSAAARHI